MSDAVLTEVRGAGLWLTLNRPDKLNGLGPEVLRALVDGLARAESDPAIHALVIAANGRAFCAGADLAYIEDLRAREGSAIDFIRTVAGTFDRIERSPLPVIASVGGIAAGGGLELILACDLVVLSQAARLGDAHANYGLLPGGGATARLPKVLGTQRAKQLMFTGDLLPAAEAFALGLGTQLVAADALEQATATLVDSLARKSPLGLAEMKRLAGDALDKQVAVAVRDELAAIALHEHSFDMREGVQAFNEKRAPRFEGR